MHITYGPDTQLEMTKLNPNLHVPFFTCMPHTLVKSKIEQIKATSTYRWVQVVQVRT
jgi:hypothetical protein